MTAPDLVDLRSDTVTKPSAAMREAMARAEVGDDVYGEDPTVRRLEERTADIVGKEAAIFVPSGTMANQIAFLLLTRRGEAVIGGEGTHSAVLESGAAAAWSGVQFTVAGTGGLFDANDLERAVEPRSIVHARPSLVVVENTHNRAGGRVFSHGEVLRIARVAKRHGLRMHLDGARLWNAAAATGQRESELAAPFDTVSVCFSKGLGAPVGSALAGPRPLMDEARRYRKMLGGGMRQAGVIAAGALFALDHHRSRLTEDHVAARAVAEIVATAGTRLSTHNWRSAAAGNLGGWQVSRTLFLLNALLGAVAERARYASAPPADVELEQSLARGRELLATLERRGAASA